MFERLIERSGVPLIFDFDDAVFVPTQPFERLSELSEIPRENRTRSAVCPHM